MKYLGIARPFLILLYNFEGYFSIFRVVCQVLYYWRDWLVLWGLVSIGIGIVMPGTSQCIKD